MPTIHRTSTTEMDVTSIRLERELKEHLKALAGSQGYQALIRDILWNYVQQKAGAAPARLSRDDIRASFEAIAQQPETCALTGQPIQSQAAMWLGLTHQGDLVPLSHNSLAN